MQASQRIAGNNLYFLLADTIGDGLAAVATSATNLDVTIPGHSYTAENIGQSMFVGALAGGLLGTGGRYAIAAINGAVVSFTVAGFTASSGTVSLFGWNFHQVLYNGITATYPEPAEGWVLEIRWAVSDRSTEEWFEKERDALAELVKLANHHDRVVEGRYVNLTSPGCHDSTARVRPARGVA